MKKERSKTEQSPAGKLRGWCRKRNENSQFLWCCLIPSEGMASKHAVLFSSRDVNNWHNFVSLRLFGAQFKEELELDEVQIYHYKIMKSGHEVGEIKMIGVSANYLPPGPIISGQIQIQIPDA